MGTGSSTLASLVSPSALVPRNFISGTEERLEDLDTELQASDLVDKF